MNVKKFISAAGVSMLALTSNYAATITQIANDTSSTAWATKSAPWAAAPVAGNDYVTAPDLPGATTETASGFGENYTTRLRDTGSVFPGNSLTVVGDTEVLQKGGATSTTTANLIFAGGIFAYGNAGPSTVNLAGGVNVQTTGLLGMGGNNILNVVSTLTGGGTLFLSSADTTPTINFTGDDTAFNGTFQIGDAGNGGFLTVDFTTALNAAASLKMDTVGSTLDVLDLSTALTVSSFEFGTTSLAAGTYTADQLNSLVGDGSQFNGGGTITIASAPEPSAVVLVGFSGAFCLLFYRRTIDRSM